MANARPVDGEDRISEAYYGELWSESGTKRARNRVHWMCKSAQGPRVLDIGCSQGIASILLAREGLEVVGIDTSPVAIDFANADRAKETAEVQSRVVFRQMDLFSLDDADSFDSVILGEVLEHQVDPERFFRQAMTFVSVGGQLIATTPFGYAPHEDHKSTMFLSWLFRFADLGIHVDSCEVTDGCIRLIVTKLPSGQSSSLPSPTQLLRRTESGTLNSQRRLHAMIDQRQEQIEQLAEMQKSLDDLKSRETRVAQLLDALGSISALTSNVDQVAQATSRLPDHVDNLRHTADELSRFQNIGRLQEELAAAKSKESVYRILSNKLKRTLRELDASRQETAGLRNSVSLALGQQLVSAARRPLRFFLLPALMWRAIRRVKAARRNPRVEIPRDLTKSTTIVVVGTKTLELEQTAIPEQSYELVLDIVGETTPCQKGILLEIILDESELQSFLQFNQHFRKRTATGTAFMYVDLSGIAVQRVSTALWNSNKSKRIRLALTRFRGMAPITVIVHKMQPITREAALSSAACAPAPVQVRSQTRQPLKVLSVLDTFTESCLEPEVELVPASRSNWRQEIKNSKPDLLFVESAWRGNGGEWNYALTKPEKHGRELKELIEYCRDQRIPTLFWNKEDPANFDTFIDAATWFDSIFTTDSGSIKEYRAATGRDNAFVLPFAAQASMHNPVRHDEIIQRIAFTGSWRGQKYPRRAEWIETLLNPIAEAGLLDIFDRYAGVTDNPDLIFPAELQSAVKGALVYKDLVNKVYKRYAAFINVNSVDTSETMLARRVFEILACGAPVISSPSPAIEQTFGDIVLTPSTPAAAIETGERLLNDIVYREDLASRGVRLVHSEHTYAHRLEAICDRVGLPYVARKPKLLSAICVSKRPEFLEHVHTQLARQTHADIELIFVQNSAEFSADKIGARFSEFKRLKLLSIPEDQFLANGLNAALDVASGDYIAKIDDDDYYGPNYLSDALMAFDYAPDAGLVGKKTFFAYIEATDETVLRFPGQCYRYCRQVHGGTLVWNRRRLEGLAFEPVQRGTDTKFLDAVRREGIAIFSSDPFNFAHVRYSDKTRHTWTIDDQEFISKAIKVGSGLRKDVFLN
ncbi:MAG TPA: methyltransferase domain-containing protein [Woeseiaceae bacterium]|nr:methyltransferase domain-containing protein [Woeseiaceae bacterium]